MATHLDYGTMDNQYYLRKSLQCTLEEYKHDMRMAQFPLSGYVGSVFRKVYVSMKQVWID